MPDYLFNHRRTRTDTDKNY